MRILIGYDGSQASKAALYDLHFAGLYGHVDVRLVTVADSWQEPRTIADASRVSQEGIEILRNEFPSWKLTAEVREGSPPREMLAIAETMEPDLLVLGERENIGHGTSFLGQTTQTLLTEAECSVRIARGKRPTEDHHEKILVGFNGSPSAARAIDAIVARNWGQNAEVRLLAVADASVLGTIGRFTPQMVDATIEARFAHQWAETLAAAALEKLTNAGFRTSLHVTLGHPAELITEHAESWGANSIFVGPHCSLNSFERFLLGSVSVAVSARASCSVEVVRLPPEHN